MPQVLKVTVRSLLAVVLTSLPLCALAEQITLTGQIVCSSCWFEADRTKVPYGTPEDMSCWARCAKKGLPTALAVPEAGATRLYHLEFGQLKKTSRGWAPYVGKQVEARGTLRQGETPTLVVDALETRASAAPPSGPPSKARGPGTGLDAELPAVAPDYELIDLSGTRQTLSSYRGKVVVLNFWATWCAPCRKEIPALARVQNAFAPWGVHVIGASADETAARSGVEAFVGKSKVNFSVWLGATTADMERFGLLPVLPATVIIDREGRIAARINGETTEKELKAHLSRMLKTGAPARSTTGTPSAEGVSPEVRSAAAPRPSSVPS